METSASFEARSAPSPYPSDPLGLESCAATARDTAKRRQRIGGVGDRASKRCNPDADDLLMSKRLMSSALLACLAFTGCNYVGQNNPPRSDYQRFVPVPREGAPAGMPWSGAFALDTKTGQLCWTYLDI